MEKIGPYQILETIHQGPQPLFKVKAADGRVLALKAIPVDGLSAESRERFMREAETCKALDHPNLTKVFEVGEADGMLYQAMELLEGGDLGKVMGENRPFTWEQKLSIMEQVSAGLEYAHARHLVHRDIKPANLFLENSGRVRVLDFGMVRVAESELTKAGSSLGTLNYMSPEQIRGERCTSSADVFSAGIVFFQLATGRHPFSARDRSLGQVVSAIVFEAPPKLTEVSPDAPEGLEFILNRSLEKDPAKRLQTGGDLKQALELCRTTMGLGLPPATPAAAEPAPAAVAMQAPQEGEKTRAMPRTSAAAAPVDEQKTKVMKRAEPAAPAPVAPPPPPPAPAPPKPKAVVLPAPHAAQVRFCPICTAQNAVGAAVCRKCGNPLSGGAVAAKPTPWGLYAAIAVAVLLAIALVVVLIVKR
jgi:eukaryotic-like serine/threonine-protein kinase